MPMLRARFASGRLTYARRLAGCGLITIAVSLVPISWVTAAVLHAQACGFGLEAWTCPEPLAAFALHQALVSLSATTAVLLFAVGDVLRRVR